MDLSNFLPDDVQNIAGGLGDAGQAVGDAVQGAADGAAQGVSDVAQSITEGGFGDIAQNLTEGGSQALQDGQEQAGNIFDDLTGGFGG